MDSPAYVSLTRQSGLSSELRLIANNIANISTSGFRRERNLFTEMVRSLPVEGGSISMTDAGVRVTDFAAGAMAQTGGSLDLAIDGEGFFQVETPRGPALTRSGAFGLNADGELVTADGLRVLGDGGAPVLLPPDAGEIAVAGDGTISIDGAAVARIGVVVPEDPTALTRRDGVLFEGGATVPAEEAEIVQGFVEGSNVSPVQEMARMVFVQRAYELGQALLDREDERIRTAIRTLGQRA